MGSCASAPVVRQNLQQQNIDDRLKAQLEEERTIIKVLLLFDACCLISAVYCLLPAACCLLSAVCCPLSAVCCLLSAVCRLAMPGAHVTADPNIRPRAYAPSRVF
jgi:hypothetical protein